MNFVLIIKAREFIFMFILVFFKTLPVMLYNYETWSLHKLKVFENRFLWRIFRSKKDENGEWRRLNNEELHCLYRAANIVTVIKSLRFKMDKECSQNGRK